MSVSESEFEWVALDERVESHQEDGMFVLHSDTSPFGWLASSEAMEVRQ